MGFSSAPGYFLVFAVVFWLLAVVGYFYSRILLYGAGILALICTGSTWTATMDHNNAYGKPKCPRCKSENTVRPWNV